MGLYDEVVSKVKFRATSYKKYCLQRIYYIDDGKKKRIHGENRNCIRNDHSFTLEGDGLGHDCD